MAASARRILIPILLAASLAFVQSAFAQAPAPDPIGAARDLYASARYDEALAMLNDLHPADPTGPANTAERKSIEQYRSLCLLALGRGPEAESAIAAVVTADPTYLPSENEASPRVRSAFSDVRKKLLPEIAAARYADAKALFDKKEFKLSIDKFKRVITLVDDPDMGGRGGDLRTLATGFLDLAVAATAPPPEPLKPATPPPPPPPAQPDPNKVYTLGDKDIVAPTVLRQEMPRLTPQMTMQAADHGVIEIVINDQGRVESAIIRQPVQPLYDSQLLSSARDWRYAPAMMNGVAVKYRKLIQINISR
jgi:hypothetical protein